MANADVPETHVLAIASHVTSGYVGNTMATFCMQLLGCEVSAIHTVNYSNHVGYRQFKGRKSTPEEVEDLFEGLRQAKLDDFDVLLSGYCPSAELVDRVGKIGRELKLKARMRPGSFFWVLDPVMGDNGRIYVAEDTVPAYKALLRDADLILPNQFEAELLSEVKIHDLATMQQAITKLHETYRVPHIIITSMKLPPTTSSTPQSNEEEAAKPSSRLSIIGSTRTSDLKARLFRITIPAFPVFFSGTGDMFAALIVARFRQAAQEAGVLSTTSWCSPDDVAGPDLPLARAAEKTLASMHSVLKDTTEHYDKTMQKLDESGDGTLQDSTAKHLYLTRAVEVRVVRNTTALLHPPDVADFRAQQVPLE